MFEPASKDKITALASVFLGRKLELSNYFGISAASGEIFEDENSLLIRVRERNHFRLYCMSVKPSGLKGILQSLDDGDYVLNVPSKGDISQWKSLMFESGFSFIGMYERMSNYNIQKRGDFKYEFAVQSDFLAARKLIDDNFSIYTDYPPSDDDLLKMITENRMLCTKKDSKLRGLLAFTEIGSKCYLNIWVDEIGGPKLIFDIYSLLSDRGFKSMFLWVNSENQKVKKIHEFFGAKVDGLKDYSFLKKCTGS